MTVSDIISAQDALQPNPYSATQKIAWLNQLFGALQAEIWLISAADMREFTAGTDIVPKLPAAYSGIWGQWLKAQIHHANEEDDLYATAAAVYSDTWGAYLRWFAKRYEPMHWHSTKFTAYVAEGTDSEIVELDVAGAFGLSVTVGTAFSSGTMTLWAGNASNTISSAIDLTQTGTAVVIPPVIGETLGITFSGTGAGEAEIHGKIYEEWQA